MKKNYAMPGMVFLILAQTMVGINIVTSKLLLTNIPVMVLLEIRFALAAFILLLLHWVIPSKKKSIKVYLLALQRRDWFFLLAQALTAGFLFNAFMLTGLNYTDANVAGIITSALPAMIAVISWLVLKEKITLQTVICISFATIGLLIISYSKLQGVSEVHSFFGDAIILLSLLPEATYYVLCKLYSNRLPVFLTSALLNGVNALLLFPVILYMPFSSLHVSSFSWVILCLIGLSSGLFYVFWSLGAQRVDGVMASLSTAIMPVATVILAWAILHEQLTGLQLLGMLLVILSVFVYARK